VGGSEGDAGGCGCAEARRRSVPVINNNARPAVPPAVGRSTSTKLLGGWPRRATGIGPAMKAMFELAPARNA